MTEPNAQELKFEEALARLEEIVRLLEQGESTLDESLTLFEEGVKLARFCSNKLDEAEGKIEIMIKEGQIQPLEVAEE
ncbi:MAG: exodeoxyribonuclease VII small subunit [Limnochordia bacterium]|jgi:exodeoxyribonuclease VII small subunit|nr:exodeoxyribonuclease VII small subunit [Limnochordia bacterium]MDI9465293.1 exodeoxyribonuclease VII small subunit [Bacillota bacterium]NLO94735.1 exodeoxyribonuclease VII small subunit [Bacillota bacterium]HAN94127.1 exodeoxyribonuclease VII small subunit [Bacillota bacterium]HOB40023.1 exodeoxyribonuclease VII small subunit [Limnochordia bacterium]